MLGHGYIQSPRAQKKILRVTSCLVKRLQVLTLALLQKDFTDYLIPGSKIQTAEAPLPPVQWNVQFNGRVFVFGSNEWGQLGLGHRSVVTKPSCVKILKPEQATHVACGRAHTIISTGSGKVFACGNNSDGQLGVGDTTDKDTPTPVEGVTGPVEQLAAGCHHSVALNTGLLVAGLSVTFDVASLIFELRLWLPKCNRVKYNHILNDSRTLVAQLSVLA
ncbi:hypothetical protein J6590_035774 [Homalodisca vitripennis]|nr:hypothetical protein J6590_035774 [Homalodisca vitripennis]